MVWVHRISKEFIQTCLAEAQKDHNKNLFQVHVLDPIVQYALGRLFPYIIATSIVFLLTFVLAVAILVLVMQKNA